MNAVIREAIDISANSDLWGEAVGAWFSIADAIEHRDTYIRTPASWQYRHSPVCDGVDPEDYLAELIAENDVSDADLLHAGNVLERYTRQLERRGLSY